MPAGRPKKTLSDLPSNWKRKLIEIASEGGSEVKARNFLNISNDLWYRLKPTGQHCTLHSYSEDGTVTIDVDGHDSEILDAINKMMPVQVFGINPDDLEIISADS